MRYEMDSYLIRVRPGTFWILFQLSFDFLINVVVWIFVDLLIIEKYQVISGIQLLITEQEYVLMYKFWLGYL